MPWVDSLLERMLEVDASDLHLASETKPMFRIHGDMVVLTDQPEIPADRMRRCLAEITPERNWEEFEKDHDTDFAYDNGCGRFRCNLFVDRKGPAAVLRHIPSQAPTVEQLKLPQALVNFCYLNRGLVVVTGPAGSGKTTTLAALVNHINHSRSAHIITIEDPIEYVHENKKCLISQREVHRHTGSFKQALRAALREDPDIILLGEMRDLETMEIALEAAETGHLVFGTLHTNTAASTVDRIIDQFSGERQAQIRTMLAGTLKGVVAQTLCKTLWNSRVVAVEVLVVNAAIASHVRESKTHQIPSTIQLGKGIGMQLLNESLLEHVVNSVIDPMEAYFKAVDKLDMLQRLKAAGHVVDITKLVGGID